MNVVVSVRITGLQCEHGCVWWGIQLHHSLHGQGAVNEVWRLIVDVLDVDYHALVVGIYKRGRVVY